MIPHIHLHIIQLFLIKYDFIKNYRSFYALVNKFVHITTSCIIGVFTCYSCGFNSFVDNKTLYYEVYTQFIFYNDNSKI